MNVKKSLVIGILGMFLTMFVMSFVVAVEDITAGEIEEFTEGAIDNVAAIFNPIFRWLVGESGSGGELALKVLAFLMVVIVIYGILDSIKILGSGADKKYYNFAIGIIVATIGIRFMPQNLLTALTAPSSAFVALIFLGIPFLAAFFIIKKMDNAFARRLAWFIYAFLVGTIALYNAGNLSFIAGEGYAATLDATTLVAFQTWGWIYWVFALAALALGLFDGSVQRFFGEVEGERYLNRFSAGQKAKLEQELKKYEEIVTDPDRAENDEAVVHAKAQISRINAKIEGMMGRNVRRSRMVGWRTLWIIIGAIVVIAIVFFIIRRFS